MGIRRGWLAIAATVLSSTITIAQSNSQPVGQSYTTAEMPVTLIGCLQREAEYRRAHGLGRGGALAAGVGVGDEYVLVNASRVDSGAATRDRVDCSQTASGDAYELTGRNEHALKPYIGRPIQISGVMKKAKVEAVGTSGTPRPTGGVDPWNQDLRLFEVNVTSFGDVPAPVAAATPEPAAPQTAIAFETPPPPAEREPQPVPSESPIASSDVQVPEPIGTAGRLPRTASPFPFAGLLGFLSLGAAFGVRRLRRR